MTMAYVEDVRTWFDQLVDEPDQTWLTVAQRRQYLSDAYDEFRRWVRSIDPDRFLEQVDITVSSADSYDLGAAGSAVRLLGNPAGGLTGSRLYSIDLIGVIENSEVTSILYEAQRLAEVVPSSVGVYGMPWANYGYRLIGTVLRFTAQVDDTLRLWYVPESQVQWNKDASGDNEFIDNLTDFHELIALLAAKRYITRDQKQRPAINNMIATMTEQFEARLAHQRTGRATSAVIDTYWG